jgi:hypothetical protein
LWLLIDWQWDTAAARSTRGRHEDERIANLVANETGVAPVFGSHTCVEKLAQLFPGASPVRIPVRVVAAGAAQRRLQEHTAQEVLFASMLPIEFEDRLRITNSDGSLDADATVVAVRYHEGRKAVAARFSTKAGNWIIQP